MSSNYKKRKRTVYIHNPDEERVSLATTSGNTRIPLQYNPAPPPSPEKPPRRMFDNFDYAMGYSPDDDSLFVPDGENEGPERIIIQPKKSKRYVNSDISNKWHYHRAIQMPCSSCSRIVKYPLT
ncbi:hypothetical protein FB45DRAFT_1034695 [Roridomyces roridus]|uniref:Uncharacterized protein n=1 Tax=Roridomyces roridus TaxID=1738132 RepID=A0AAD7FFN7_9AGAR|nr:hypothetical protein FB45DRAFT_1034695 [Roridomyces roridus]